MILTVTPNPALDVTYEVAHLVPHASHRVERVREMAGGKGLNVSSVLTQRGIPTLVTGLVGGAAGGRVKADLDGRGIDHSFAEAALETRRTVTVVGRDDGDATAFNEPGATWSTTDWGAFLDHARQLVATQRPSVLVASGSTPPGFPLDGFAVLTALAHEMGCLVVVDTSGDSLLAGLQAGPDVVKPNRHELLDVTGLDDAVLGARALQDRGARHVVVSLGPEGLVAVAADGSVIRAVPGEALRGNPTGAGDAAVAAIAAGLADGRGWTEILADAVAWSGAAVLQPVAGVVDPQDVERLRAGVRTEQDRS